MKLLHLEIIMKFMWSMWPSFFVHRNALWLLLLTRQRHRRFALWKSVKHIAANICKTLNKWALRIRLHSRKRQVWKKSREEQQPSCHEIEPRMSSVAFRHVYDLEFTAPRAWAAKGQASQLESKRILKWSKVFRFMTHKLTFQWKLPKLISESGSKLVKVRKSSRSHMVR